MEAGTVSDLVCFRIRVLGHSDVGREWKPG
jgi:hypothetical protein